MTNEVILTTSQKQSIYQQCRNIINYLNYLTKIYAFDEGTFSNLKNRLEDISYFAKQHRTKTQPYFNNLIKSQYMTLLVLLESFVMSHRSVLDNKPNKYATVYDKLMTAKTKLQWVLNADEVKFRKSVIAKRSETHVKLQEICREIQSLTERLPISVTIVLKENIADKEININVGSGAYASTIQEQDIKRVVEFLNNVSELKVNELFNEIKGTLTPEQIQLLKNKL